MTSFVFVDDHEPRFGESSGGNRAAAIAHAAREAFGDYLFVPAGEHPASPRYESALATLRRHDGLVWTSRPGSFATGEALARATGSLLVYDMVDNHRRRLLSGVKARGNSLDQAEAMGLLLEDLALRTADQVVAICESERPGHRNRGGSSTSVLGNPWTFVDRLPSPGQLVLGFAADWRHVPNRDSAHWFVESVFPALQESFPGVRLILGGRNARSMSAAVSHDIQLMPDLPDMREFYAAVSIAIAPLTYGAGLKGKVAEAYSFGRPVIGSSEAFAGYPDPSGWGLCAHTADEYAESVGAMSDVTARERFATEGAHVLEAFLGGDFTQRLLNALPSRFTKTCHAGPEVPEVGDDPELSVG